MKSRDIGKADQRHTWPGHRTKLYVDERNNRVKGRKQPRFLKCSLGILKLELRLFNTNLSQFDFKAGGACRYSV
jgi:hypothetical protein